MGLARVYSRAILGMDAPRVIVEVHVSSGLPCLSIVGLPEASVKESKERVRSALLNSGFEMPAKRITVNLAPADLPKTGGRYDLAIAIGILIATEQISAVLNPQIELYGELALTGELMPVNGLLPSLLQLAHDEGQALIPEANRAEQQLLAQTSPQLSIACPASLREASLFLVGQAPFSEEVVQQRQYFDQPYELCLSDVQGQVQAKRLLEICATGSHSLLMVGEPGAGKSMLAARLITLLPPLNEQQALQNASLRSLAGGGLEIERFYHRPFLSPHHSASAAAVIGGGKFPKPGAISLANHGVLFLDELPEFNRDVLEALREPLETGRVDIARVQQQVSYPAQVQLIAAFNPTPSGYFPDDPLGRCKDTPAQISRYLKKLSGPLLDRIDCHLEVPAVNIESLQSARPDGESSAQIRARVTVNQQRQFARQACLNAHLSNRQLNKLVKLDASTQDLLAQSIKRFGLSARSYYRILRLALTIADMAGCDGVKIEHLAEALSYRLSQRLADLF
ncbi:ATP-dependent protease [Thiosulfatimonas sediminis]|uniref:ATP-dependent protease n=1 Tax=Thiosulfatimonas sediminis TaxID=2675054 RepID=A0A6F8PRZ1_9GAMM|nr:YifB family Mg chelatase-like AAA ATPase [Thiosulfatimonas sediminis]BBP44885.1 ATP-dependent protease [Thiosulfatimonas sediminis]